jgi:hypothetical protein
MRAVRISVSINICKIYYSGGGEYKITKWCYWRQWLCQNLRYYPNICLEGFMKTMKNISHDSWSLDWGWTWDLLNTKLSTCPWFLSNYAKWSLCCKVIINCVYISSIMACSTFKKSLRLHCIELQEMSTEKISRGCGATCTYISRVREHEPAQTNAMFCTGTHVDWWWFDNRVLRGLFMWEGSNSRMDRTA